MVKGEAVVPGKAYFLNTQFVSFIVNIAVGVFFNAYFDCV